MGVALAVAKHFFCIRMTGKMLTSTLTLCLWKKADKRNQVAKKVTSHEVGVKYARVSSVTFCQVVCSKKKKKKIVYMLAAFYCRILFIPTSNILATPNRHSNVTYFILECRDMALPLAGTHSHLCTQYGMHIIEAMLLTHFYQLRYVRCVFLACKKSRKECIHSHIYTSSNCNIFIVVLVLSGCLCWFSKNLLHISHNCGLRHLHTVCLLNFAFELVSSNNASNLRGFKMEAAI